MSTKEILDVLIQDETDAAERFAYHADAADDGETHAALSEHAHARAQIAEMLADGRLRVVASASTEAGA